MFGKTRPTIAPGTDIIAPPFRGEWGWHKVHKKAPNKLFTERKPLRKTDICMSCHIKEDMIFNPHIQLKRNGEIIKEKCLYCHTQAPDEKKGIFETHKTEVQFRTGIGTLCMGWHSRIYELAHPVNAMHLLKPKIDMLRRMKEAEIKFGIVLPLDYKGNIMCATCHNPHERGVMPNERSAAKGASEKFRVRLTNKVVYTRITAKMDRICLTCHKDKEIAETKFPLIEIISR
jgi:hypothetical protein